MHVVQFLNHETKTLMQRTAAVFLKVDQIKRRNGENLHSSREVYV